MLIILGYGFIDFPFTDNVLSAADAYSICQRGTGDFNAAILLARGETCKISQTVYYVGLMLMALGPILAIILVTIKIKKFVNDVNKLKQNQNNDNDANTE